MSSILGFLVYLRKLYIFRKLECFNLCQPFIIAKLVWSYSKKYNLIDAV